MVEIFDGQHDLTREDDYLRWVEAHPSGYIVNTDRGMQVPTYPIVHRASHKLVSSDARANYTMGRYIKLCSVSLDELDAWAAQQGKCLYRCGACMK